MQTWFESNVRCPMCRFDIREHRNRYRYNLNTVNEEEPNNGLAESNGNTEISTSEE